jgi:hypothetical protein
MARDAAGSWSTASQVMHAAIMVATTSHPDYFDPMVVIGGFMSHLFYTVALALVVKRRLAAEATG